MPHTVHFQAMAVSHRIKLGTGDDSSGDKDGSSEEDTDTNDDTIYRITKSKHRYNLRSSMRTSQSSCSCSSQYSSRTSFTSRCSKHSRNISRSPERGRRSSPGSQANSLSSNSNASTQSPSGVKGTREFPFSEVSGLLVVPFALLWLFRGFLRIRIRRMKQSAPRYAKSLVDPVDIEVVSDVEENPSNVEEQQSSLSRTTLDSEDTQTSAAIQSPRLLADRASSDTDIFPNSRLHNQSLEGPPTSRGRPTTRKTQSLPTNLPQSSAISSSLDRPGGALPGGQPVSRRIFRKYQDIQVDKSGRIASICTQLKTLIGKNDFTGVVYILTDPLSPGYLKIGQTRQHIKKRTQVQVKKCERSYRIQEDDQRLPFKQFHIVEKLVHAELSNYRRVTTCHTCKVPKKPDQPSDHEEWFEMEADEALKVIHRWRNWVIDGNPYNSQGRFNAYWQKELQELESGSVDLVTWLETRPTWEHHLLADLDKALEPIDELLERVTTCVNLQRGLLVIVILIATYYWRLVRMWLLAQFTTLWEHYA